MRTCPKGWQSWHQPGYYTEDLDHQTISRRAVERTDPGPLAGGATGCCLASGRSLLSLFLSFPICNMGRTKAPICRGF